MSVQESSLSYEMHNVNAPGENFDILAGGAFLFFSAIFNRVATDRRLCYPGCFIRTGLGAGGLNKRFCRMGTSRHCLPTYFLMLDYALL